MRRALVGVSSLLLVLALTACGGAPPGDAGVEDDAGPGPDAGTSGTDGGVDSGVEGDAGSDAGAVGDAGRDDAGALDAGEDAGVRGPAPEVSVDASISIEDAGYAEIDLLTRDPLVKTAALTLDGGFLVAVSRHALVVAEGPQCEYSQVNRYACDYRWVTDAGTSLVITNATGEPHERGEVMLLRQDQRPLCTLPPRVVESATATLVDLERGAVRLAWPRTDTRLLPSLGEGDFVADHAEGSTFLCDGGVSPALNGFTRVRPPHQRFVAPRARELSGDRLLLLEATEVSRVEADGGRTRVSVVPPQRVADAHRELDTFTLRLDDDAAQVDEHFRGALDGGGLASLGRFDRRVHTLSSEGGRFVSVIENQDYQARRVVDSAGVLPDLRYPGWGVVLERAPVMVGSTGGKLVVSRLDLGTTAPTAIDATPSALRHVFPGAEAALVLGPDKVAWLVERTGLARLTTDATAVAAPRVTNLHPRAPRDVLLLIRAVAPGQRQLVAVDRDTHRLVTLSSNVHFDASDPFVFSCARPGFLTVDSPFLFFAEPSAQPGHLDLFLVRADLTTPPRLVGTTATFDCQAPVASRDGARFAVNEDGQVSVGDWL